MVVFKKTQAGYFSSKFNVKKKNNPPPHTEFMTGPGVLNTPE